MRPREAGRRAGRGFRAAARDPARLFRTPFAVTGTAACPMNLFSRLTLADACLRFDAADRDQRLAVQALAMPMLARRLTWLRLVLRASPDSAATRSTIGRIERACAARPRRRMRDRRHGVAP
ncbi:hypothetical protein [Burkholderia ubonensis]|uniref:hypothetical protein n=1 Tax=Burkholderia ubonensis TaxID=101571 RepID=UPI000A570E45|nr:hypothetical protein [Burkholderia ubonensis]